MWSGAGPSCRAWQLDTCTYAQETWPPTNRTQPATSLFMNLYVNPSDSKPPRYKGAPYPERWREDRRVRAEAAETPEGQRSSIRHAWHEWGMTHSNKLQGERQGTV